MLRLPKHNKHAGFTLIELMVVFSIMTILSAVGIAGYVNYSHSQEIDTAAKDFRGLLFTARSRAQSQLRDSSCYSSGFTGQGYELKGYQVVACCSFALCSQASCGTIGNNYELQAVYGYPDGSGKTTQTCEVKKFPSTNIRFASDTNTTATYFFFASVTGAVSTNASGNTAKIGLSAYSLSRNISVSTTGVIQ